MTQFQEWIIEAISHTKTIYHNKLQEWNKTYTTTQNPYMTIGDIT